MADRVLHVVAPVACREAIDDVLARAEIAAYWSQPAGDDRVVWRALLASGELDPVLDALEARIGRADGFHAFVLKIEALLPRPEPEAEPAAAEAPARVPQRISRAELHEELSRAVGLTPLFLAQVVLATIVGATGLVRDLPAIVIAGMVIAPLLGPNVALALGTTLGDVTLVRRAIVTNVVGVAIAFTMAGCYGLLAAGTALVPASDPVGVAEIAARTKVSLGDVLLALASGVAGALAFASGIASSLVGVMVAVALLPPTIVCAVLLASGAWDDALGAAHLLGINVVSVNLAAVSTFLVVGLRPGRWWEAEQARRASQRAIALWASALLVLVLLILVAAQ